MINPYDSPPTTESCLTTEELREQALINATPLIKAVCVNLTKENTARYERGEKPIRIFNYITELFQEALLILYMNEFHKKLPISKKLNMNRGTLRKKLKYFNIEYEEDTDK